jgi:hypothetical protein
VAQIRSPSPTGLLGRLLDEVHVVEVSEVKNNNGEITVGLVLGQGMSQIHTIRGSGGSFEEKFISSLKSGRRYRFPHCVIDELGIDNVGHIARTMPGKPLASIKNEKPFRAVVLDQGLGSSYYSIIVREAGGRLRHFHGSFEDAGAKEISALLSRGRSFEFPAVLEDALRSKEERRDRLKPKDAETAALYRYLGEWRGGIEGSPKAQVKMISHPRADGSGIWREVTFTDGSEDIPPLPDISSVAYDRSEKRYLASSVAGDGPPPLTSTWDEKTRTFTTLLAADERGRRRLNTATFTRDDRIDWKTITQDQKGEPLASICGHYDRVRALDLEEGDPLPPTEYPSDAPLMAPFMFAQPVTGIHPLPKLRASELGSCSPFRALVGAVTIDADTVEVQLRHMGGAYVTLQQKLPGVGNSALGKALAQLKRGKTYEFPFCIQHPGMEEVGKPTTPEMKALEPFIGRWSLIMRDPSGKLGEAKANVRCFWSADGAALWREVVIFGGGTAEVNGKTVPTFSSTTHSHIAPDPATREYVESRDNGHFPRTLIRATWDSAKRSYTWKSDVSENPNLRNDGIRTVATPDLIEWRERQLNSDGSAKLESTGVYQRIKE